MARVKKTGAIKKVRSAKEAHVHSTIRKVRKRIMSHIVKLNFFQAKEVQKKSDALKNTETKTGEGVHRKYRKHAGTKAKQDGRKFVRISAHDPIFQKTEINRLSKACLPDDAKDFRYSGNAKRVLAIILETFGDVRAQQLCHILKHSGRTTLYDKDIECLRSIQSVTPGGHRQDFAPRKDAKRH